MISLQLHSVIFISCFFQAVPGQTTPSGDAETISSTYGMIPTYKIPTYRISTVVHAPWMMKTAHRQFEGFIVDLLEEIAKQYPFNYTIEEAPDKTQGMIDHVTGQWGGVIGEVIRGKADIGAADLRITEERSNVVAFTSPFVQTGAQILLKKPLARHTAFGTLLYPFTTIVWVLLIVVVTVVGVVFYGIDRFSPNGSRNLPGKTLRTLGRKSFNVANSYMFSLSSLLSQGHRETPKCISGRILALFWWVFVCLLLFSYSSNLTALFISTGGTKLFLPFKTFFEMAQQTDVVYGGWFGLILNPNDPLQRTMARFVGSRYTHYHTIDKAVTRIRLSDGQFAAIVEGKDAEYIVHNNCDLILLREELFTLQYGIACRLDEVGTRLCADLSSAIMSLHDDGTIHRLEQKWWEEGRTCPETAEDEYFSAANKAFIPFRSLTISDVSLAFLLLVVGVVMSLVALLVEIVYHKRSRIKKEEEEADLHDVPHEALSPAVETSNNNSIATV